MENKFHTFQIMSFFFLKKVLYIFSHLSHIKTLEIYMGFSGGSVVKNSLPTRRRGFSSCFGKIHWLRKWPPTPVFLP